LNFELHIILRNHRAHRASYRDETIVTDKGDRRYGKFAIKNFLLRNPYKPTAYRRVDKRCLFAYGEKLPVRCIDAKNRRV